MSSPVESKEGDKNSDGDICHPPSQLLHDLLSVGEIEAALLSSSQLIPPSEEDEKLLSLTGAAPLKGQRGDGLDIRLPLLLRWLSVAHPGTSNVARVRERLEDVAAAHPDAENVEAMVSIKYDVIGKLSSLSRRTQGKCISWNTKNLDLALHKLENATSSDYSRKRQTEQLEHESGARKRQKTHYDNVSEQQDTVKVLGEPPAVSSIFAQSSSVASDDSHELSRVLQELVALVKSSLQTDCNMGGRTRSGDDGGAAAGANEGWSGRLSLKSDSLFAEPEDMSGFSRLSLMIPILMQNAPLLRHEHVAVSYGFRI